MKRLASVLFWSVISAAFIGPGTVTTCAVAGATHGFSLLWALIFSTVACFALQEAAARMSMVSGRDLGEALGSGDSTGVQRVSMLVLVVGAIIVGCAAYEAGNILGAVAGIGLVKSGATPTMTCALTLIAGLALWNRPPATVARMLSVLVAVMGIAFLCTAWALRPPVSGVFNGALLPSFPPGAGLLVLGLVGTTVVPYNLFLGSGIAGDQRLSEMRFGLAVAIGVGGLVSMAILVVGTAVSGAFTFSSVADVLANRLGAWARTLFGTGLLAAGLSSAITAPLAAAITARGLFARSKEDTRWQPKGWRFRSTWLGVLAVGLIFGVSGARPVPVILLAQALNGVLLPVIAIFLLLAVNDRRLMGEAGLNSVRSNAVLSIIVLVAILLGTGGVLRAVHGAFGLPPLALRELTEVSVVVAVSLGVPVALRLRRSRAAH